MDHPDGDIYRPVRARERGMSGMEELALLSIWKAIGVTEVEEMDGTSLM